MNQNEWAVKKKKKKTKGLCVYCEENFILITYDSSPDKGKRFILLNRLHNSLFCYKNRKKEDPNLWTKHGGTTAFLGSSASALFLTESSLVTVRKIMNNKIYKFKAEEK